MDASKVGQGQLIAGAAGVLLFISLFFHWGGGQNAWDAFSFVEIWLLLTALAAVAWGLLPAFGVELALPAESALIVGALGMAAVGWSFGLETEVSGAFGVWLAIVAGLGIAFGGFSAIRTPSAPAPRRTAPPPRPPAGGPPAGGPPSSEPPRP